MEQETLELLLAEWQKTLRLQDWLVGVRIRRIFEMSLENSQGVCRWEIRKKEAWIEILNPIDYGSTIFCPQDIEKTLVHELLHLHFAPFATSDQPADTHHEQAIEMLARALVGLKRRAGIEVDNLAAH